MRRVVLTRETEVLTKTTCPVEMSRFEVTGSSDLKLRHKYFKRCKEIGHDDEAFLKIFIHQTKYIR